MAFEPFGDEPLRPKIVVHTIGQDLSTLSVNELDDRIQDLKREIDRLNEAKAGKLASKHAADTFFKSTT